MKQKKLQLKIIQTKFLKKRFYTSLLPPPSSSSSFLTVYKWVTSSFARHLLVIPHHSTHPCLHLKHFCHRYIFSRSKKKSEQFQNENSENKILKQKYFQNSISSDSISGKIKFHPLLSLLLVTLVIFDCI